MSFSGAGLYDDDTGHDVRSRYRELVADGLSGDAATDALVAEWGDALMDAGEAAAFWLALADTQWRIGRLEDRVRARAIDLIDSGEDLARFDHDRRLHDRRTKILGELRTELEPPQRSPTRLRKPFRSTSPVAVGDVFWFELPDGKRVLFRCIDISGDERDNSPTVEVLDWDGPEEPADIGALRPRIPEPWPNGSRPPDLLLLIRYPRDPDPAERVTVIAIDSPVTRRTAFPAMMTAWADLPDRLHQFFRPG